MSERARFGVSLVALTVGLAMLTPPSMALTQVLLGYPLEHTALAAAAPAETRTSAFARYSFECDHQSYCHCFLPEVAPRLFNDRGPA